MPLNYNLEANGLLVIKTMEMNETAQGQYLDVEKNLRVGRGEELAKGTQSWEQKHREKCGRSLGRKKFVKKSVIITVKCQKTPWKDKRLESGHECSLTFMHQY